MKIAILVVSHSYKLAEEAIKLALTMKMYDFQIANVSGLEDSYGSDTQKIYDKILKLIKEEQQEVLIIGDLGSSILASKMAIEMLDEIDKEKVKIVNCPFLEGLIISFIHNDGQISLNQLKNLIELESKKIEKN